MKTVGIGFVLDSIRRIKMSLLALTIVSHLTVSAFKPLNLWKAITRTQQVEEVVKPAPAAIAEAFGRAA